MLDQGNILKASAALRRFSVRVLSRKSGVSRSRVTRIFAGTAAPTEDEFVRLLTACGVDAASLLTSIVRWKGKPLGKGVARTPEMEDHHLLALLLLLLRGPPSREIGEDYHLTVDRLALTFSVLDEDALLQLLHREASRVGSSKLYKHVFHRGRLGDGVHRLQIDHGFLGDRGRTSRIDFIRGDSLTAAALQEDGAFLSDLAKFAVRTSWRVSRVDVAVDAPFSIHHIQALDSSEQKALRWIGSRGVETISLGGRRSEHEIELYDKRQQLMDRGRADESHPQQTRIEARRKNVGGSLCELPSLRNPFTSLVLLCLGFDGPLVDALLAGWSAFVGVAGVEAAVRNGVVTASSFDKFKARAASRARKLRVVHPAAVFDSNWDQLSNDLVRRLSVLGIGGVR